MRSARIKTDPPTGDHPATEYGQHSVTSGLGVMATETYSWPPSWPHSSVEDQTGEKLGISYWVQYLQNHLDTDLAKIKCDVFSFRHGPLWQKHSAVRCLQISSVGNKAAHSLQRNSRSCELCCLELGRAGSTGRLRMT